MLGLSVRAMLCLKDKSNPFVWTPSPASRAGSPTTEAHRIGTEPRTCEPAEICADPAYSAPCPCAMATAFPATQPSQPIARPTTMSTPRRGLRRRRDSALAPSKRLTMKPGTKVTTCPRFARYPPAKLRRPSSSPRAKELDRRKPAASTSKTRKATIMNVRNGPVAPVLKRPPIRPNLMPDPLQDPRDAASAGRSRQWLGELPAARMWAACQRLPPTPIVPPRYRGSAHARAISLTAVPGPGQGNHADRQPPRTGPRALRQDTITGHVTLGLRSTVM